MGYTMVYIYILYPLVFKQGNGNSSCLSKNLPSERNLHGYGADGTGGFFGMYRPSDGEATNR